MRKFGPFFALSTLFWLATAVAAQQPAVPNPTLPAAGVSPGLAAESTTVTAAKFKLGQRIRAAREARATRRTGLFSAIRNRRRQGGAATPGAPTPAAR